MPGISERVYPDEMDTSRAMQGMVQKVFRRRYRLARAWLRQHFRGRPLGSPDGGLRLADVACGCGFGSSMLADLGQVVGADIDPASIQYAVSHYSRAGTSFRVGDVEDRSFLDSLGRFDAIVSLATVEHLRDPQAFLGWIRQALRPGGACVLGFPASFTRDWAAPHHRWDISRRKALRLFADHELRVWRRHVHGVRFRIRDLKAETRANEDLPVPPLLQWVRYYLGHPHHFFVRMYQISVGPGILFASQQYLLHPAGSGQAPGARSRQAGR